MKCVPFIRDYKRWLRKCMREKKDIPKFDYPINSMEWIMDSEWSMYDWEMFGLFDDQLIGGPNVGNYIIRSHSTSCLLQKDD